MPGIFTLAHATPPLALELVVILGTAAIVATIFQRFKLDSIPGYLIAGAIIGPGALGAVRDTEHIAQISQLAIILLMFGIGMHLDVTAIRRGMVHILAIGAASTLLFSAGAWGAMMIAGLSPPAALLLALAMSMSSTAVFVRILTSRREFRSVHGRVGLGIAIVQDLAAVIVLALIPPIARWAGAPSPQNLPSWFDSLPRWLEVTARAGVGLGGVTLMLVLGKSFVPWMMTRVARVGSAELLLVLSAAIALGAAVGTSVLGFSPEMGAFLAGFLLASTPFRYQLGGQISPMRDLLMAVFFTAVGLSVQPAVLAHDWWIVGLGAVGIIVWKVISIGITGWASGMTATSALLSGACLATAGEFTLVVISGGSERGVFSERVKGDAISVVILTLIACPLLLNPLCRLAHRAASLPLARWTRGGQIRDEHPGTELSDHIIIAGFGPVGRNLANRFEVLGVPFVVVELNPTTVARQLTVGRTIVYGDITNPEVLESAGLRRADAVILTIPDEDAVLRATRAIRAAAPDVFIAARTAFLSQAFNAQQLGADHVTVEEIATAQAMEREVMGKIQARRAANRSAGAAVLEAIRDGD